MRCLFSLVATVLASGCVSLGGDPLLRSMQATPVPPDCHTSVQANGQTHIFTGPTDSEGRLFASSEGTAGELCSAIRHAIFSAGHMHSGAVQLDNTQAGLGGTQLVAGIATAGFAAFKAHPDNILAAALIGGSALAARDGLRPAARRDVLRTGLRALNCTAERGSVFLLAAQRIQDLEKNASDAAAAALLIPRLAVIAPPDAAAQERLDAALGRLDAAILAARQSMGATREAVAQVNDTRRIIERNVERRLSELPIDYTAIVTAIGKVAPPAPNTPTPTTGRDAKSQLQSLGDQRQEGVFVFADAVLSRDQLAYVADYYAGLLASATGPGQAEYADIAKCATEL